MTKQVNNTSRKASQGRGELVSTKPAKVNATASPTTYELIKPGVDTHAGVYMVARMIDHTPPQPGQKMTRPQFMVFVRKQQRLAKRVVVAYEAGPFGFHLARELEAMGVECLVVAPQNWDERNKKTKTDRIDAREIVGRLDRFLAGNPRALAVVRVPSVREELARDISRQRDQFRKDRQVWISRGRSLLQRWGVEKPGPWWSRAKDGLKHVRLRLVSEGHEESTIEQIVGQLVEYQEAIDLVSHRLEDLTDRMVEAGKAKSERVRPVCLGQLSLEKLEREVGNWDRFKNRRQVGSYTGLCPGRSESGGRGMGLSINKCGNARLREVLVEAAWLLPRFQKEYKPLEKWKWVFDKSKPAGRAVKKKAIVALARRLAIDLWRLFTGRAKAQDLGLRLAA